MCIQRKVGKCIMAIKKVKLNCVPVVSVRPPVERIAVPSSHMEALGRSMKQKIQQNEVRRAAGMEAAGRYMAR